MRVDDPGALDVGGDVPIDGQGLSEEKVRRIIERRKAAAVGRSAPREAGTAVIVCLIGGEAFAVPLAAVAEVLPAVPSVRVPSAPSSLEGLIVRRGLVYNLLDPSAALGVGSGTGTHYLLLRGPAPRIALRVDEAIEAAELGGAADDGGGLTRTCFRGDGARVELIEVARLLARLDQRERAGPR